MSDHVPRDVIQEKRSTGAVTRANNIHHRIAPRGMNTKTRTKNTPNIPDEEITTQKSPAHHIATTMTDHAKRIANATPDMFDTSTTTNRTTGKIATTGESNIMAYHAKPHTATCSPGKQTTAARTLR